MILTYFWIDFSVLSPITLDWSGILDSEATLAEKYTYLRAQTELGGVFGRKSYQNKPCASIEHVVGARGSFRRALNQKS